MCTRARLHTVFNVYKNLVSNRQPSKVPTKCNPCVAADILVTGVPDAIKHRRRGPRHGEHLPTLSSSRPDHLANRPAPQSSPSASRGERQEQCVDGKIEEGLRAARAGICLIPMYSLRRDSLLRRSACSRSKRAPALGFAAPRSAASATASSNPGRQSRDANASAFET